jgi:hypothetical protein
MGSGAAASAPGLDAARPPAAGAGGPDGATLATTVPPAGGLAIGVLVASIPAGVRCPACAVAVGFAPWLAFVLGPAVGVDWARPGRSACGVVRFPDGTASAGSSAAALLAVLPIGRIGLAVTDGAATAAEAVPVVAAPEAVPGVAAAGLAVRVSAAVAALGPGSPPALPPGAASVPPASPAAVGKVAGTAVHDGTVGDEAAVAAAVPGARSAPRTGDASSPPSTSAAAPAAACGGLASAKPNPVVAPTGVIAPAGAPTPAGVPAGACGPMDHWPIMFDGLTVPSLVPVPGSIPGPDRPTALG